MIVKNKNVKIFIAFIMTFILLSQTFSFPVYGETDEYAWVLKEVVDYNCKEEVAKYNENNKKSYELTVGYQPCSYYKKRTYIGSEKDWQGESLSVQANWSTPPNVIKGEEAVTLNFTLAALDNTQSFFDFGGSTQAYFDKAEIKPGFRSGNAIRFINKDGKNDFVINKKNNYKTISDKITTAPKTGSEEEEQLALMISFKTAASTLGTKYIYEWTNKTFQENSQTKAGPKGTVKPKENNKSPINKIELPEKYIDSGIRFSDLSGEVQIRHDDDRLGWEIAELDMVICEGDHICTSHDSCAVLILDDFTTFVMKPNSELIIPVKKEENKLKILAGKIITNLKRGLETGSFPIEYEMSQGVLGIKGTTFVIEEDGTTSTLKVLEGKVELTTNSGQKLFVTNSEMVDMKNGISSEVKSFSAKQELKTWNEKTQQIINDALKEKGIELDKNNNTHQENEVESDKNNKTIFILIIVAVAIILIFTALKLAQKTKKNTDHTRI